MHCNQRNGPHFYLEALCHPEADEEENDQDDNQDQGHDDELHLDVLPPHFVPQRASLLLELVCLEAEVVRLVHEVLQTLPPLQHLVDVLHHDGLDLVHLFLDGGHLVELIRVVHHVRQHVLDLGAELPGGGSRRDWYDG